MTVTRLTVLILLASQLLLAASVDTGARESSVAACQAEAVVEATLPRTADEVLASMPPGAEALLLIDRTTGVTLVERDADTLRVVASTVKMLTALTVLRHAEMTQPVRISQAAASARGARIGIRAGEEHTVGVLLAGMMVRSGNDAALALAEHVAGTDEAFAKLMQHEANRLGIAEAIIEDPSGLRDRNQFSARQLATIADAVLSEPLLRAMVTQPTFGFDARQALPNRNLLIGRYVGATGVKTGFTSRAGNTLVASAERNGRELIAVVLGAGSDEARFARAEQLLDYGFTRTFSKEVDTQLSWTNTQGVTTWQMPATTVVADTAAVALTWSLPKSPYDAVEVVLLLGQTRQCSWRTVPAHNATGQLASVGEIATRVVAHAYGADLMAESSGTLRVPVQGERS